MLLSAASKTRQSDCAAPLRPERERIAKLPKWPQWRIRIALVCAGKEMHQGWQDFNAANLQLVAHDHHTRVLTFQ